MIDTHFSQYTQNINQESFIQQLSNFKGLISYSVCSLTTKYEQYVDYAVYILRKKGLHTGAHTHTFTYKTSGKIQEILFANRKENCVWGQELGGFTLILF